MLTISTWVNNHEVERIELVRIHPTGGRPADYETCTYKLRFYDGEPEPRVETTIKHPYHPDDPKSLSIHALHVIQSELWKVNHDRTVSSTAL
jgi:hypothetical protein